MNDSPQQRYIAPIPRPYPERTPRVGDNFAQLTAETNLELLEAETNSRRRSDTASVGYAAIKAQYRR
jgi:hypothetical protein